MKKLTRCEGSEFAFRATLRLLVIFGWLPLAITDISAGKPVGSRIWPLSLLLFSVLVAISIYSFGGNLPNVWLIIIIEIILVYILIGVFYLTSNYHHL